jgi:hypothetical protein
MPINTSIRKILSMPKTDYADPETDFPRLEVRAHTTDPDAFWIQIWVWDRPGDGRNGERRPIMNGKQSGSLADIRQLAYGCAAEQGVYCDSDDITIDGI